MPSRCERLIAFLAVRHMTVQRSLAAGSLWPDASDDRAHASLRSALWSIPKALPGLVVAESGQLCLTARLSVDYYQAWDQINRLIESSDAGDPGSIDSTLLTVDLLEEWSEDWILIEQERFRQMRVHALESLSERLSARGLGARAVQAGMAAVAAEPLRETAHRALICAYAAEGNRGDAVRQFRTYENLVRAELGLEPSPAMRDLVAAVTGPSARAPAEGFSQQLR